MVWSRLPLRVLVALAGAFFNLPVLHTFRLVDEFSLTRWDAPAPPQPGPCGGRSRRLRGPGGCPLTRGAFYVVYCLFTKCSGPVLEILFLVRYNISGLEFSCQGNPLRKGDRKMCTFVFTYTDQSKIVCEHVKSAFHASGNGVNVSEQELVSHHFPINRGLWLNTENGSFCVNHDGLRCIEVKAE